ncbi:MAG: tRNA preQ1(34) S-adenosylmethionine ribosyltransferase-isomerase QueA [Candidatus Sumerlaeota bacterium]|nr:tRNA preQ1(34) S-adenosylmethionine ribosyltransferase-isomerase QueA [Candidatus Sumerlaeota bacterium]
MRTSDFDYALPEALVARRPAERRDESRLLVLPRYGPLELGHRVFHDLPGLLRRGDLLVLNQSRVIPARLIARRAGTGATIEILLLEEREPFRWVALARPGKKAKPGDRLVVAPCQLEAEVEAFAGKGERVIRFHTALSWDEALATWGHTPLPPYILKARRRDTGKTEWEEPSDRDRYQTVYAAAGASVAAPTAGLHFTPELLTQCDAAGIGVARIELDVGAGTFLPVESENPAEHPMHAERFRLGAEAAAAIAQTKAAGGRVVAVGTTVVRALETVAREPEGIRPCAGATNLFILPGFEFRAVDALITNFHLPRSTLLMLAAAFAGRERLLAAYEEAVRRGYRFYSYGDAMWIG